MMPKVINAQIEIADPRMNKLIDARATMMLIDDSSQHCEGPVYIPADDSLVWSDVIGDRVLRWQAGKVSLMRENSRFQNGNALDLEGRIVACSHGDRAIVRQEHSGHWHILVDRCEGKKLNSPNDLAVKSDGTIWFTDPPFGLTQPKQGCEGEQEQPGSFVFRFDPTIGEISAVITDMVRPNGLAFSPDESLLYVSDTSAYEDPDLYHHIRVYDILAGKLASNGRVFTVVSPGQPDGLCIDYQGNIFSSSQDGVQVFAPDSTYLGKLKTPDVCTNLTIGGPKNNRLFITLDKAVHAVDLKTFGSQRLAQESLTKEFSRQR